jgi:glyoxylase-like metal-dependent hydrolase (beta-lactamase superfamily II)
MRAYQPGQIQDHLWYFGRKESGVYLLEGAAESMIISGGMSYIVPEVLRQFEEFGINKERITKLLILHSHFDHVGIVPFFKRLLPDLQIYASSRAWEILGMPKAVETINKFSRHVAARMGMTEVCAGYDLDWWNGLHGVPLREGDSIGLGDGEVVILETPGHSSCSISAYVPKLEALFPSDAGGIPYGNTVFASGNSNFTEFQRSLEKLSKLKVHLFGADHYGYITGEEAARFMAETIETAKRFRAAVEECYRRIGDIDAAAKELIDAFYREHPDYFLSPEIHLGVYRQIVRHIAGALES